MGEVTQGRISPAKRKGLSRGWIIGLSIAGVCGLLLIAVVVAGLSFLFGFGVDIFADMVRRDIQSNPVIVEQIGAIEEIELDLVATANEEHAEVFVFRLKGAKGQGTLTARCVTSEDDIETVVEGSLLTPSGETWDLFSEQASGPY